MLDGDLGNIGAILSKFADTVKMCLIVMFKKLLNFCLDFAPKRQFFMAHVFKSSLPIRPPGSDIYSSVASLWNCSRLIWGLRSISG